MSEAGYLHGFTAQEQERLKSQSLYLEPVVFGRIDYQGVHSVLEIGCGVGAQLKILARRFPHLSLTGVDLSPVQLAEAKAHLKSEIAAGRVKLTHSDGAGLPFVQGAFDGLFLCWILEHVPSSLALLREARRLLGAGGVIYCTEVFNSSLFVSPSGPALKEYWERFNAHQRDLKGDPDVGPKVAALMHEVGFHGIESAPLVWQLDSRTTDLKERTAFADYWFGVMQSGAQSLLAAGVIKAALVEDLKAEFAALTQNRDALVYVTAMQTRARG